MIRFDNPSPLVPPQESEFFVACRALAYALTRPIWYEGYRQPRMEPICVVIGMDDYVTGLLEALDDNNASEAYEWADDITTTLRKNRETIHGETSYAEAYDVEREVNAVREAMWGICDKCCVEPVHMDYDQCGDCLHDMKLQAAEDRWD